jgi:hypothetical protein
MTTEIIFVINVVLLTLPYSTMFLRSITVPTRLLFAAIGEIVTLVLLLTVYYFWQQATLLAFLFSFNIFVWTAVGINITTAILIWLVDRIKNRKLQPFRKTNMPETKEIIDLIRTEILQIYRAENMTCLSDNEFSYSGVNIMAVPNSGIQIENWHSHKNLRDIINCNQDLMYFTANLFLYRPYINDPMKN